MKNNLFAFKRLLTPQFIYPISLFAVFFVLYIQSFNFRLGDQFYYAKSIETGRAIRWAEPGHLFYRPLGWLIYEFFQIFGYTGRAVTILQFESAFFGAIGVGAFFYLVYGILKDIKLALFSALILAFSHSYWAYSGNGSAYVPSTAIMIFAAILLFKLPEFLKPQRRTLIYVLAISLISAVSALLWMQQSICFAAIVLGLILMQHHLNYRKRFTLAFIYVIGLFFFFIMPLILGVLLINEYKSFSDLVIFMNTISHGHLSNILGFLLDESLQDTISHGYSAPISIMNIFRVIFSVANAFVAIPDLGATVRGLITGDFNLVGTRLIMEALKFLAAWAACLMTIFYLIVRWKTIDKNLRTVILILCVWILPFFFFGVVWSGTALERMLPALPSAILAMTITLYNLNISQYPLKLKLVEIISIVMIVVLSVWNFSGFFIPARNIANDKDWKIAKSLGQKMNPDDLAITWGHDMAGIGNFMFYYSHRLCIDLNTDVVLNGSMGWNERLARAIKNSRANGGKALIHDRLVIEKDVPESRWSEKEHPHPNRQELRAFFSQYRKIFFCIIEDEVFWEITK